MQSTTSSIPTSSSAAAAAAASSKPAALVLALDCREAALIAQCRLLLPDFAVVQLEVRQLPLGDALIERRLPAADPAEAEPLLLVERKTAADLLASLRDGRYEEQSWRLARHPQLAPHDVVYLLEGPPPPPRDRRLCYSVLASCQVFKGFSVWRTTSVEDSAFRLLTTAAKMAADLAKGRVPASRAAAGSADATNATNAATTSSSSASYVGVVARTVKSENITPANICALVLSQVPGVGAAAAAAAAQSADGDLRRVLDTLGSRAGREILRALPVGGRRLGDAAVAKLCAFLRADLPADTSTQDAAAAKTEAAAARTAAKTEARAARAASAATAPSKKRRTAASTDVAEQMTIEDGGGSFLP